MSSGYAGGERGRNVVRAGNNLVIAAALILGGCSKVQKVPLSQLPVAAATQNLTVTSPDFGQDQFIPDEFSSYFANKQPTIRWTPGPVGTRSYALLVEDPDAPKNRPFVHWLVTDIPATSLTAPGGGKTVKNENGESAYYGPHPPEGSAHRYFFQVFALDVPTLSSSDRDGFSKEIAGHVLAKGVLIGLYQKKPA